MTDESTGLYIQYYSFILVCCVLFCRIVYFYYAVLQFYFSLLCSFLSYKFDYLYVILLSGFVDFLFNYLSVVMKHLIDFSSILSMLLFSQLNPIKVNRRIVNRSTRSRLVQSYELYDLGLLIQRFRLLVNINIINSYLVSVGPNLAINYDIQTGITFLISIT